MDCRSQWHCYRANCSRRRSSHSRSSLVAAVLFGLTAALSVAGARRGGGPGGPSAKSLGDQTLTYSLSYRVAWVVNAQFGLSLLEVAADGFLSEFELSSDFFRWAPD